MTARRGAACCVGRRRGAVLLVVFVLVVAAALVTAGIVDAGAARRVDETLGARREQARLMAWSGVRALLAEFAAQRETLLLGGTGTPAVSAEWTGPVDAQGRRWMFRVRPDALGRAASPEAARLDVNRVPADVLGLVEGLGPEGAKRLVAGRAGVFGSVEEALERAGPLPGAGGRALLDRLTVYAADPTVQAGVGENVTGEARVDVATPWTPRLRRAIAERFGEEGAAAAQGLFENRDLVRGPSDLIARLREASVPEAMWGEILDAVTAGGDRFRLGLIDLNRADAATLALLPGIDDQQAEQIVSTRERLSEDDLASVVWPLMEGILDAEALIRAADWLTTRSLQWRVRVEGGWVRPSEEAASDAGLSEDGLADAGLGDRFVFEAVIDVADARPRVAMLREVTTLEAAGRAWRAAAPAMDEPARETAPPGEPGEAASAAGGLPTAGEAAADEAGSGSGAGANAGAGSGSGSGSGSGARSEARPRGGAGAGGGAGDGRVGRWAGRGRGST